MATYAIRLQSVLGPVVERARRWSQSSAAEDRPAPPVATLLGDDYEPPTAEASVTTPAPAITSPHSPRSLTPVFESFDVDSEDTASEQTFIVIDPSSGLRPPMPGQSSHGGNPAPVVLPPSMSPPEGPTTTPNQPHSASSTLGQQTHPVKSSTLPEDDGQRVLRQKLVEISKLNVSERERATRMHLLMLEKYNASRLSGGTVGSGSPLLSGQSLATAEELRIPQQDNPYKLSPRDITKTYYTGPSASSEIAIRELGCSHYRRGVKLQCSTCEKWHTCRFCHDENEDHALVRKETKNMLCMHCGRAQPVGQDCRHCGVRSARYYCDKVCILGVASKKWFSLSQIYQFYSSTIPRFQALKITFLK